MIVSFEGRGDHTFIALAEDFEKVKQTPEEIFSQLALQMHPPKNRLETGSRNERGMTR